VESKNEGQRIRDGRAMEPSWNFNSTAAAATTLAATAAAAVAAKAIH